MLEGLRPCLVAQQGPARFLHLISIYGGSEPDEAVATAMRDSAILRDAGLGGGIGIARNFLCVLLSISKSKKPLGKRSLVLQQPSLSRRYCKCVVCLNEGGCPIANSADFLDYLAQVLSIAFPNACKDHEYK